MFDDYCKRAKFCFLVISHYMIYTLTPVVKMSILYFVYPSTNLLTILFIQIKSVISNTFRALQSSNMRTLANKLVCIFKCIISIIHILKLFTLRKLLWKNSVATNHKFYHTVRQMLHQMAAHSGQIICNITKLISSKSQVPLLMA